MLMEASLMAEKIETILVSLLRENGDYTVDLIKYECGSRLLIKNGSEQNLRFNHMEKALNHFGKQGWMLDRKISFDEERLEFSRIKMGWINGLFRNKIRYRKRNVYIDKKTGLFEIGADTPFEENSSVEDVRLNTLEEVIKFFSDKYEYKFLCKSHKKEFPEEFLIELYFCKQ